jgi:hypothetical protein
MTSNFFVNTQQDSTSGSALISLPTESTSTSALVLQHNQQPALTMDITRRSTCLGILDQIDESNCDDKCEELNLNQKEVVLLSHDNQINVDDNRTYCANTFHPSLVENEVSCSFFTSVGNKEKKWKQHDDNLNNVNSDIVDEEIIIIPLPSTKSMSSVNFTTQAKQNEYEQLYKQQQYQQYHQQYQQYHQQYQQQCNQYLYPSLYDQYYYYYYYYNQMMLQNQNQNQSNNINQMQSIQQYQALQNYNNQLLSQCFPTNQNNNNQVQSTK